MTYEEIAKKIKFIEAALHDSTKDLYDSLIGRTITIQHHLGVVDSVQFFDDEPKNSIIRCTMSNGITYNLHISSLSSVNVIPEKSDEE